MIKPGVYAFKNARTINHVCGRAYSGSMVVTASIAQDAYVGRLVESGAMAYSGEALGEVLQQPKLIDRTPAPAPAPASVPEPEAPKSDGFHRSSKGKDRR
jgi:hypothetical protein